MTTPSARTAFRLGFAAGLIVLALTVASMLQEPAQPCGGLPKNYAPIIAFELARTQADLDAIFGTQTDTCRTDMIAAMDTINWIDVIVFVPLYGAFLLFCFAGLRTRDRRLANAALTGSAIAIVFDYAENACLMNLTPALDAASPWFTALAWATGVKWLALGTGCALAAILLGWRAPRRVFPGLLCIPGALISVAAVIDPARFGPYLGAGIGLGWISLLITAATGSLSRPDAAETRHIS